MDELPFFMKGLYSKYRFRFFQHEQKFKTFFDLSYAHYI